MMSKRRGKTCGRRLPKTLTFLMQKLTRFQSKETVKSFLVQKSLIVEGMSSISTTLKLRVSYHQLLSREFQVQTLKTLSLAKHFSTTILSSNLIKSLKKTSKNGKENLVSSSILVKRNGMRKMSLTDSLSQSILSEAKPT